MTRGEADRICTRQSATSVTAILPKFSNVVWHDDERPPAVGAGACRARIVRRSSDFVGSWDLVAIAGRARVKYGPLAA